MTKKGGPEPLTIHGCGVPFSLGGRLTGQTKADTLASFVSPCGGGSKAPGMV